jgi:hypothetical protein
MGASYNKPQRVIIQKPISGTHSSHAVHMEGIANDLPSNHELWAIKEPFPGNFHPDNGPALIEGNKWSATAYIGNAKPFADQGLRFKIHVVMAQSDSKAAEKYRSYLETANNIGWPGLPDLYGGIIVATVEVVRDDQVFSYDIALSFAGEQRDYVQKVASILTKEGISVFYDKFEESNLWGKDLYEHLDDVYRKKSKYCIIFISKEYSNKNWTNHERKSALERAFRENAEYILPVRFDDTEIPGVRSTIGYIDARKKKPKELVNIIKIKLSL